MTASTRDKFQKLMRLVVLDQVLVYDDTDAGGLLKTLMDAKAKLEASKITNDTKSLLSLAKQCVCVVDGPWKPEYAVFSYRHPEVHNVSLFSFYWTL